MASLPLQMLVYFNTWWFALYWLVEMLCFIYKGSVFPYKAASLGAEIFLLFVFALIESIRLFLTSKGNLTERKIPLLSGLLLAIGTCVCYLFYLLWQTYV